MKRSSSYKNSNCKLQLSEALQLIAMLEQTVMSLQQANQDLIQAHIEKDMIIAERDQTVITLLAKQNLDKQTISAQEEKNQQNALLIDNLNYALLTHNYSLEEDGRVIL
ncbi:hypothetical protein Niako_3319 [Niastella koreensis GR20-10]|uniref:Uncharacterized protein n=2 Tax=Niastella koreensis TaxID=354356 RepID=G8TI31_NIAKG|nr:hypothetical protein Niako_3319 [Niastella koreensis GR20-10]